MGAAVAAAMLLTLVAAPWLALASPATPAAGPRCEAPPRSQAELTALFATPLAATPVPTSGVVPAGTPANSAIEAELAATVAGWLACQNAGEPLRAWSWFTDAYLRRLLDRQGGVNPAAYDPLATPEPAAPDDQAAIAAIRDARLLPDGRAGATVTLTYPAVPMPKTFFFTFARVDSRWLIDGILGEISFSVP
ncbi:MAG TPA: hypothetical protein VFU81_17190 [Thermomicrobiales bacterium]|nr:hypothetical protein [Thermomicrobiales bacterium]